jgi:uncharacterized membrane protein
MLMPLLGGRVFMSLLLLLLLLVLVLVLVLVVLGGCRRGEDNRCGQGSRRTRCTDGFHL